MKLVKIFDLGCPETVEKEINKWIHYNSDVIIHVYDIRISTYTEVSNSYIPFPDGSGDVEHISSATAFVGTVVYEGTYQS